MMHVSAWSRSLAGVVWEDNTNLKTPEMQFEWIPPTVTKWYVGLGWIRTALDQRLKVY